jgi:hypothetical protein
MKLHKIKEKGNNTTYYYSAQLGSQSAILAFNILTSSEDHEDWSIGMAIARTRKQALHWYLGESKIIDNQETGKDLFALYVWAKNILPQIEKDILSLSAPEKRISIIIQGADKRRFNVYKRVLTKFGYEEKTYVFKHAMVKTLKEIEQVRP